MYFATSESTAVRRLTNILQCGPTIQTSLRPLPYTVYQRYYWLLSVSTCAAAIG